MNKLTMLGLVDKDQYSKELVDKISDLGVNWVLCFREITKGVKPDVALTVLAEGAVCIIKRLVSDDPEELRKAVKLINKKLTDDMEFLISFYQNV